MRQQQSERLTLFGPSGTRKYLNAAERVRFERAAARAPPRIKLFCLTLRWTGGRISEVLAVTPSSLDLDSGVVSLETLKRRKRGIVRQVPLPPSLLTELDRELHLCDAQHDPERARVRIWRFSRTTAWRYVKAAMAAAGIVGAPAMPKGLRHSF
ncbi:MAG: tyrosine-type recombinase/integrase [Steroidobacteraceae bacterium]|jgi:integrase